MAHTRVPHEEEGRIQLQNLPSTKDKVGENVSMNNPIKNPISLKTIDTSEGSGPGSNISGAINNSPNVKFIKNQK